MIGSAANNAAIKIGFNSHRFYQIGSNQTGKQITFSFSILVKGLPQMINILIKTFIQSIFCDQIPDNKTDRLIDQVIIDMMGIIFTGASGEIKQ